jgi:hypothetical protein
LADLNSLSNAHSEESFEIVLILFVRKWEGIPAAEVLIAYLKKEWFTERLRRFYRGAADGMCMNNNGLESNNRLLKDTGTFHEQMPILEFLPTLKAWIGSESCRRDPENVNCITFALKPDIGTKELTEGWALLQIKMDFIRIQEHYISVDDNTVEGERFTAVNAKLLYEQYRSNAFDSFDHYKSFQKKVHIVTPGRQCNCYQYGREFTCPHTIAISIIVDKIHVPDVAKGILVGTRRKSGRPKLARDRYEVQDYSFDTKEKEDQSKKSKGTKRKVGSIDLPEVSQVVSLPEVSQVVSISGVDDIHKALDLSTALVNNVTPISHEKSVSSILVPYWESIPMESLPFFDLLSMRYLPLKEIESHKVNDALSANHDLNAIVTRAFGIPIAYQQLWTLRPTMWLVNDVSISIIIPFTIHDSQ